MIVPDELVCPDHNYVMGYSGVHPIMKQFVVDKKLEFVSDYYHVWKCPGCGRSVSRKKEKNDA